MANSKRRATWQLPDGVSPGTWDYSESHSVAQDYDGYFQHHGMFGLDQRVMANHLKPGRWVVDLGCGTGRALEPLLERGLHGVAFDLSQQMLETVRGKPSLRDSVACIRGNAVDLSCFRDESFDYAVCLFSTLGMIRGSDQRERTVAHVSRALVEGGLFVLQVHNYWVHVFDPEGPLWMLRNLFRSRWKKDVELGDRIFPYRGIPNMYLHSFRKQELVSLLRRHEFEVVESMPLNARQDGPMPLPWLLEPLRASGWIVVARKVSTAASS
jgi:SAM-dependent methyltransferase